MYPCFSRNLTNVNRLLLKASFLEILRWSPATFSIITWTETNHPQTAQTTCSIAVVEHTSTSLTQPFLTLNSPTMPKNKGKGGKNRRRGKNDNEDDKRELVFKTDSQGTLPQQLWSSNQRETFACAAPRPRTPSAQTASLLPDFSCSARQFLPSPAANKTALMITCFPT